MNVIAGGSVVNTLAVPQTQRVMVERETVRTAVVGRQGPVGPQGIPGPAGAVTQTIVAGEALGGHRWVVPDAAGAAVYADNANLAHASKVLGMTICAALLGADVQLQSAGEHIEPTWAWTLDQPVFLGSNGLMTQTAPTTGFSQIVGFPITATKLMISLREPLTLN